MRFYWGTLWDRQDQKGNKAHPDRKANKGFQETTAPLVQKENKDPLVRLEHKAQKGTPGQQEKMVPMALTEKVPTKWLWKMAMLARNYNGWYPLKEKPGRKANVDHKALLDPKAKKETPGHADPTEPRAKLERPVQRVIRVHKA